MALNLNQEKSFTLIELLVVIAVIGLLAGIVLVAISGVRERAQLSRTASWAATNHRMLSADNVLSLDFEECRGVATSTNFFRDASGFNNNGTCTGAACPLCADGVPGVSGRAVRFDGVDDFIEVPHSNNLESNRITIKYWIYLKDNRLSRNIISKRNSANIGGFVFETGGGSPNRVNHHFDIGTGWPSIAINYELNEWLHIAIFFDGFRIKGYKNGVFQTQRNISGDLRNVISVLRIGKDSEFTNIREVNAIIDDVRIYSAAMPLAYIQEQYLQGLKSLLANNGITEQEYNQRIAELNKNLVLK